MIPFEQVPKCCSGSKIFHSTRSCCPSAGGAAGVAHPGLGQMIFAAQAGPSAWHSFTDPSTWYQPGSKGLFHNK